LTTEDLYQCAKYGMLEALKSGTTLINDMYFSVDEMIAAADEMGIDMITTVTLMDVDGKAGGEKRIENFQKALIDHQGYKFKVGIHGMDTSSPEYIQQCVKFAIANKVNIVNMH
jgi:cytosine/adenosine deaminase-related metal-dependent hydrolase